jgi:GNAT superfamily N-acetyltransferase
VPANLPAGVTVEHDGLLVRVVGERRGFVTGPRDLGVRGAGLDALIARQAAFFAARGEPVEWKWRAHDEPPDLAARLRAAGFVPEPRETVEIAPVDAVSTAPLLPAGLVLREVTAERDLRAIGELESDVWETDMTWLAEHLIGRVAAAPDRLAVLAAESAGEVVAAAWVSFREGTDFANLLGGSTRAAWRGRGIYRALVGARAALARERGFRYVQVDASDDSRPILERLGFTAVTETRPFVWTPPG